MHAYTGARHTAPSKRRPRHRRSSARLPLYTVTRRGHMHACMRVCTQRVLLASKLKRQATPPPCTPIRTYIYMCNALRTALFCPSAHSSTSSQDVQVWTRRRAQGLVQGGGDGGGPKPRDTARGITLATTAAATHKPHIAQTYMRARTTRPQSRRGSTFKVHICTRGSTFKVHVSTSRIQRLQRRLRPRPRG